MLTGCLAGTSGQKGNFVFYDQTRIPEFWSTDHQINSPVATGATLNILVKKVSDLKVVSKIGTVDFTPALFQVTGKSNGILGLKATAAGTTDMAVNADGLYDTINLTVEDPAKQAIEPRPWRNLYINPVMFQKGIVVLQGSKFWTFGWQINSKDKKLTGFGASQWSVDGNAFNSKPVQGSDYLELTAEKTGESTLKYGKATYTLWAGQEKDIKSISFYDALGEQAGSVFKEVNHGIPLAVYLAMYDGKGRLVVGDLDTLPQFTSSDTSVVKLDTVTKDDIKNAKSEYAIHPTRFVLVQCQVETGSVTVTATWSGLTSKFTVNCTKNTN